MSSYPYNPRYNLLWDRCLKAEGPAYSRAMGSFPCLRKSSLRASSSVPGGIHSRCQLAARLASRIAPTAAGGSTAPGDADKPTVLVTDRDAKLLHQR